MWKRSVKIQKFSEFTKSSGNTTLAMERNRVLVINDQVVATLQCCPQNEKELIAGWAWVHQSIRLNPSSITIDRQTVRYAGTPMSVRAVDILETVLSIHDLYALTASFQEAALLYKDTGTTHSMALASNNVLKCNMEDIDPIVARYKAVGFHALNPSSGPLIVMTSSKIDESTVKIAESIGATVVISRSAPTDLACDYATNKSMTLIGYARGTRFSVYVDNGHLRR